MNWLVRAMEEYDIVIVGGGPAGVSAAIYTRRKLLRTAIISRDIGGQVLLTTNIENYPGYQGKTGSGLADIFEAQLAEVGAELISDRVILVERLEGGFRVQCEETEVFAKALIITAGSAYKKLGVPGEDKFFGNGVSVCATCDAPMTRNKITAVIGGGNAAFQSAELLSKFASKVFLVHRRESFRADGILIERVGKLPNIEFMLRSEVKEIYGGEKVEGMKILDREKGTIFDLKVQKIFIEVGREVKLDYVKDLIKLNERGQAIVDRLQRTSCKGIFAAGDITDLPYGQAIIAAGQGAVAGLAAYDFLMESARG